jgi:hypothetical protein
MILPENCQAGDIVGIFSSTGTEFRGALHVREVSPGFISFNAPLPPGTTQGDILCLIRRGDQFETREVHDVNPGVSLAAEQMSNMDSALRAAHRELRSAQAEAVRYASQVGMLQHQIASLNGQLQEVTAMEAQRRRLGAMTFDGRLIDIVREYRAYHRNNDDCTDPEDDFDNRCQCCRTVDEVLAREDAAPTPPPRAPRRRIKSTGGSRGGV